ncbi:DUF2267 domain-containing protein [Pseudaestuariivita atlantica]|uniref:DUF2267 domain-containing protein n=1 Tax=Pseudaestuariivita atlantica TaxID=1317121 RepID=UPI0009E620C3|nr:DUF2267 domain-containing protein [Pseudaestuariivita atlantica]
MSAQGLEIIDTAAHTTYEWLNELSERLDWSSKRSALRLLRATLHQIREHLLVDEMAQFSAQLPLLIKGMFIEGWVPNRTPSRARSADAFVRAIESELGKTDDYRGPEDIKYVFLLLNAHISRGEIEDVRASLPRGVRALWPAP